MRTIVFLILLSFLRTTWAELSEQQMIDNVNKRFLKDMKNPNLFGLRGKSWDPKEDITSDRVQIHSPDLLDPKTLTPEQRIQRQFTGKGVTFLDEKTVEKTLNIEAIRQNLKETDLQNLIDDPSTRFVTITSKQPTTWVLSGSKWIPVDNADLTESITYAINGENGKIIALGSSQEKGLWYRNMLLKENQLQTEKARVTKAKIKTTAAKKLTQRLRGRGLLGMVVGLGATMILPSLGEAAVEEYPYEPQVVLEPDTEPVGYGGATD